jgi:phage protein D
MQHIKKIYLYLVSLVSLIIIIVGSIMLLNMALKTWVFTKADRDFYGYPYCPTEIRTPEGSEAKPVDCNEEEQKKRNEENRAAQKQRDAAQALSMILVASPVFYYHWRLARREN